MIEMYIADVQTEFLGVTQPRASHYSGNGVLYDAVHVGSVSNLRTVHRRAHAARNEIDRHIVSEGSFCLVNTVWKVLYELLQLLR